MKSTAIIANTTIRKAALVAAALLLGVVMTSAVVCALPARAHADSVTSYKIGKVTVKKQGVTYAKTRATYKSGKHKSVAFAVKAKKSLKDIPVQNTVRIKGKKLTVVGIKAGAFKKCKATKLKLYAKHLAKKGIKGSLTGSKIKYVDIKKGVSAKKRNAYIKWFGDKKTCGKQVKGGSYYINGGAGGWTAKTETEDDDSADTSSSGSSNPEKVELSTEYGVFIGYAPTKEDTSDNGLKAMASYDEVVIDAQAFASEQIAWLKNKGCKIYSYLNVGSIEKTRDYYDDYSDITVGDYDNWSDEKWVDASQEKWQTFITDTLAKEMADKGVDGFFVDNLDVYYYAAEVSTDNVVKAKADSIYNGLAAILTSLNTKYSKPVIANGGDAFVSKYIKDKGSVTDILSGVNQECVFSKITSYEGTGTFGKNDQDTRNYYMSYLSTCSKNGLSVYVLEYTTDKQLMRNIKSYCSGKGYKYFITTSLDLSF